MDERDYKAMNKERKHIDPNPCVEFLKWCTEPIYNEVNNGWSKSFQRVIAQNPDFNLFLIINEKGNNALGDGVFLTAEEVYQTWLETKTNKL